MASKRKQTRSAHRWGYIDLDGSVAIPYRYEHASHHSEGLATVAQDGLKGCINRAGDLVIPLVHEAVGYFTNGLATAKQNNKWGFIDHSGIFVIQPRPYEMAYEFCDSERARVTLDGADGFIDRSGHLVVPPEFADAGNFSEGFARVQLLDDDSDWWFIHRDGSRAFGPFITAADYSEGIASVEDEHGCNFIDLRGKTVLRLPNRVFADRFREGIAAAEDQSAGAGHPSLWGYINRQGRWIVAPQFDFAGGFRNGLAVVRRGGKKGLINKGGKVIVATDYEDIGELTENRSSFSQGGRQGYFDETGRVVIEPLYLSSQRFAEGLAAVCVDS